MKVGDVWSAVLWVRSRLTVHGVLLASMARGPPGMARGPRSMERGPPGMARDPPGMTHCPPSMARGPPRNLPPRQERKLTWIS